VPPADTVFLILCLFCNDGQLHRIAGRRLILCDIRQDQRPARGCSSYRPLRYSKHVDERLRRHRRAAQGRQL